jgi:LmbE family N-acetylglucosaminyl deacetylase
MIKLSFDSVTRNSLFKILLLGAHSDDIEIGCGGTILRLAQENPEVGIDWIVFSAKGDRNGEAWSSANAFLSTVKHKRIIIQEFRDGFFPYSGGEIKDYFEQMKLNISPDLIFTHYRHDLHQDHRIISDLTWNTFRNHLILEYEIPKFDGDLGSPNFFVPLDHVTCQTKIGYLLDHFKTQENKDWFTEETFSSILRLRGIESKAPDKYAEAFYCRKMVL